MDGKKYLYLVLEGFTLSLDVQNLKLMEVMEVREVKLVRVVRLVSFVRFLMRSGWSGRFEWSGSSGS